jgi:hypothetical protein
MSALFAYLARCGIEFDTAINVLTGGELGETVSYRCAVAQRNGKAWGCIMCWFLNWAVQRNHCPDQFNAAPTPAFDMIRAGIAFAVGIAAVVSIVRAVLQLINHFL